MMIHTPVIQNCKPFHKAAKRTTKTKKPVVLIQQRTTLNRHPQLYRSVRTRSLLSSSPKAWSKRKPTLSRYLLMPSTLSLQSWTVTSGLKHETASWSFRALCHKANEHDLIETQIRLKSNSKHVFLRKKHSRCQHFFVHAKETTMATASNRYL